jgi:hypothetical protein
MLACWDLARRNCVWKEVVRKGEAGISKRRKEI